MKEASGELSMTLVTIVAVGIISAILVFMWPFIQNTIKNMWGNLEKDTNETINGQK